MSDDETHEPRDNPTPPDDDARTEEARTEEARTEEAPTEAAGTEQAPQPRRLTRSGKDAIVGGVSSGLGRYFDIDPILFRIGFVALSFVGGLGVLVYIALLAFVPSDGTERPGGTSRAAAVAGAVVLGVALVAFLGTPLFFFGPGLLVLGILALAAYLLWRAVGGSPGRDPGRAIARFFLVCLLGIAVLGAALGVGLVAALGGGVAIASLAVVAGLALIGAAFAGGARWMIVPALALVLPLAVVAAADIDFEGGVGDRYYRVSSVSELRDDYQLGMGEMNLDLRDVELPAGRTDLNVDAGLAGVTVWVPRDVCVTSNITMGAGGALVLGREHVGLDLDVEEGGRPAAGQSQLHVQADVGVGAIEIVREGTQRFDRHNNFDFEDQPREVFLGQGGLNCA